MAIDNIHTLGPAGSPPRRDTVNDGPDTTSGSQTTTKRASGAVDDVELSARSTRLDNIAEQIRNQPAFDAAKVDRIKAAIEAGEYPIDAKQLAAKFSELESIIIQ